ncbi:hypothetical protein GGH12_002511 [Coemansia sp. RSA 1822]|nr:hypothetical protein LPJ76_004904 [Coemansia sp. RSA 638]KAJ2563537.1 hypothetical protein GGH12_002511 [Coemansia sp. RSA 1822]
MTELNGVDDIHGFFQFASDSDSDDGLFVAARDRKKDFDVTQINYTPQIDKDAWFDRSKDTSVVEWAAEHNGLDEITFTVQRLYFKQEYTMTIYLCKQMVCAYVARYGKNARIASIREIIDIGARSAMRVDDLESTRYFYDWYLQCGGMNPGYNSFRAHVLAKLSRWEEAIEQHILYLEQRHQDAVVWENIGLALVSLSQKHGVDTKLQEPLLRLALGSYCRAFSIIHGCKNWKPTEAAVRRKHIQTTRLWQNAVSAAQDLSISVDSSNKNAEDEPTWQKLQAEVTGGQPWLPDLLDLCTISLGKSLVWIASQLADGPSSEGNDADEEKNVAEL